MSDGFGWARKLVSQNKKRYQAGGVDLDLTYLTDCIIAMGLPATGKEALYRNPMEKVVEFLEHAVRTHLEAPPAGGDG